jgi:hypothetical protein
MINTDIINIRQITPSFLERLHKLFPDIKCIDSPDQRLMFGIQKKCYMVCNDSSGVTVYFYNITGDEILLIVNDDFEQGSYHVKYYFSLLQIYNKLLYNIESRRFNISLQLINNFGSSTENFKFKFQAIMQIDSEILFIFNNEFDMSGSEDVDTDEDGLVGFTLNLNKLNNYDYTREALNRYLSKYIDPKEVNSSNFKEFSNLIRMMLI